MPGDAERGRSDECSEAGSGSDAIRGAWPEPRQAGPYLFAALGSLALHLSPLLLLLSWGSAPAEPPEVIPVRLVIEQPPPPPKNEEKPPPPGPLTSEESGAPPEQPAEAAAAVPSVAAAPPQRQASLMAPPKSVPSPPTDTTLAVHQPPPLPHYPRSAVRRPGLAATRDEYLAYLVTLTRPHLRMVPPSLINGREGTTVLNIRLLANGTIAGVAVAQGSGYPDIDERIVRMIATIGRFPPLPQWIQAPSWDLRFRLRFPFSPAEPQRH